MNPIFEQGHKRGIGHSLESFIERFEDICRDHKAQGRASAFALIFYDFNDDAFRKVLKEQNVFTKLDRLSGKDLSIFYLHSKAKAAVVESFNREFLQRLGITGKVSLPCIVFFKIQGDELCNINAVTFEGSDLITSFNDIFKAVEDYVKKSQIYTESKFIKVLKSSSLYIAAEIGSYFIQKELGDLLKKIQ